MLDGRISSCLTTLLVHLPSCNQTTQSATPWRLGGGSPGRTSSTVGIETRVPQGGRPRDGQPALCQSRRWLTRQNLREGPAQVGVRLGKQMDAQQAGRPGWSTKPGASRREQRP